MNRRMGDVGEIASALFHLSQLDLAEHDVVSATSKLAEAWPLLVRLNRVDGIAMVGELYGRILAAAKDPQAIDVLEQSRRAWTVLGDAERAQEIAALINNAS